MRRLITKAFPALLLVCPIILSACGDDGSSRPPTNDYFAEGDFTLTIDVDAEDSFKLQGISGSIDITGSQSSSQVQITGVRRVEAPTPEDAAARLPGLTVEDSKSGTEILVKTSQPGDTEGRHYIVNYTVTLPNYLKVIAVNAAGGITVSSVQNAVTATNAAGPITVTDIFGGLNLTTGAGHIDASVTMPLGETVLITTGTGDITLEIPQSTSASLSATVGVGGISYSNLTLTNRVEEPNSLTGTIGKGNGSIVLITSVGDITITGRAELDETVRFPLESYRVQRKFGGVDEAFDGEFHCAEDAYGAGGTPVYAIADGVIRYSGPMSGYGWLIVIDHPHLGVYSLYGHLSTRESKMIGGAVKKGDLIAYLAYDDEDGSGRDYPYWGPHLHFAIRRGSKSDYPATAGDGRWMGGYAKTYPTGLGWLAPTEFVLEHSK